MSLEDELETRLSWRPNFGLENSIITKSKSKFELFIDSYEIERIAANIYGVILLDSWRKLSRGIPRCCPVSKE